MTTITTNSLGLYGQSVIAAPTVVPQTEPLAVSISIAAPTIGLKNSALVSISASAQAAAVAASSLTLSTDDIVTQLADLTKQVKAGTLKTINVVAPSSQTSGDPVLSLTSKQFTAGADAWKALKGDFSIAITDSKAADALATASAADKVLSAVKSKYTKSQIQITDTAANVVSNIASLEKLAVKGQIGTITITDGKALSLKAADITKNADVFNVAFGGTTNTSIEATDVLAANITGLEAGIEDNAKLTLTKMTVTDKAANLQAAISALETSVVAGQASGSSSPKISQITVSDKGAISLNVTAMPTVHDALQLLSGPYTLKIADIGVADALKLKPPSKEATLSLAVKDTGAAVSSGWDGLQKLAATKTLSSITATDSNSKPLSISVKQLETAKDTIKLIVAPYQLAVTDALAADVSSVLKTKNLASIALKDSATNILSGMKAITLALKAGKISGVTITDKKPPTLSIADAFTLTKTLPNVTLPTGMKLNIADTASSIIAHKRFDLGDVMLNAGTISLIDAGPPTLSLEDAATLKSITQLSSKTKYNIADSANAIVVQSKQPGETLLAGAAFVQSTKIFSVDDYKAASALKKWDKTIAYSISDTVDNILALATTKSDKILKGAKTVRIVDSTAHILAKLDQLQAVAKTGQIATIASNDAPIDLAVIGYAQKTSDPEAIGKFVSVATKSFVNGNFTDNGTPVVNGTRVKITGWEIVKEQVMLGQNGVAGTSMIDGFNTPIDRTPVAFGAGQTSLGDDTAPSIAQYDYDLSQGSMHLFSQNMTTTNRGDIVHGPYVISDKPVYIKAGSKVSFDWDAKGGADAFDVYAYLLNVNTGESLELLNQTGAGTADSGWQTVTKTINASGDFKFVFVSGTFDETFGQAAGASLFINNVTVST